MRAEKLSHFAHDGRLPKQFRTIKESPNVQFCHAAPVASQDHTKHSNEEDDDHAVVEIWHWGCIQGHVDILPKSLEMINTSVGSLGSKSRKLLLSAYETLLRSLSGTSIFKDSSSKFKSQNPHSGNETETKTKYAQTADEKPKGK